MLPPRKFVKAQRLLSALERRGWKVERQSGSHRVMERIGWPDFIFSFHDGEDVGPRMLARIAKNTGPERTDL